MKDRKTVLWILAVMSIAMVACSALLFKSSGCGDDGDLKTGEQRIMSGSTERVYYLKLPENYNSETPYPLIFAFHGLGGDYTAYSEGYYDLQDVVGDEAILVYPNAALKNNTPQWDYETDLSFFDDLFAELKSNLCFDIRKVFAVGHSNGAGFTHTLGCKRGNVLRAIGPVSGSFSDYGDCTGQVAVIMTHGDNDPIMPLGGILPTRDYWVAINSCSTEASDTLAGVDPVCEAYGSCDPDYPVQYCELSGGHEWPGFASEAILSFIENLPPEEPSNTPGTGVVPDVDPGLVSFKIHFPSDFTGRPEKLSLSLYPFDSTMPLSVGPDYILSLDAPLGDFTIGEITAYDNIAINLLGVDNGDYALAVTVYVEGSSYPTPASGKDYMGLQNITMDSSTIVVETPFELEHVEY